MGRRTGAPSQPHIVYFVKITSHIRINVLNPSAPTPALSRAHNSYDRLGSSFLDQVILVPSAKLGSNLESSNSATSPSKGMLIIQIKPNSILC